MLSGVAVVAVLVAGVVWLLLLPSLPPGVLVAEMEVVVVAVTEVGSMTSASWPLSSAGVGVVLLESRESSSPRPASCSLSCARKIQVMFDPYMPRCCF